MKVSDVFVENKYPEGTEYLQVEYQPVDPFLKVGLKDGFLRIGFVSIEDESEYLDLFCNNRPYILTNHTAKNDVYLLQAR